VIRATRVDTGSYRSYFLGVKTVGIKMLKNNLSKYLKLVRKGETVLVTDRNEVIAEIRRPEGAVVEDRLQAMLEEEARLGTVTLAKTRNPNALGEIRAMSPESPSLTLEEVLALLDEIRADR